MSKSKVHHVRSQDVSDLAFPNKEENSSINASSIYGIRSYPPYFQLNLANLKDFIVLDDFS